MMVKIMDDDDDDDYCDDDDDDDVQTTPPDNLSGIDHAMVPTTHLPSYQLSPQR